MQLVTPLGEISIRLDGKPYPCKIIQLEPLENVCPNIDGRYKIMVHYEPDGKEHSLSCCLNPTEEVDGHMETGERLECKGYYSKDGKVKISIGLEVESEYYYNKFGILTRSRSGYDYDGEFYVVNGVYHNDYCILPCTKTDYYVFGVSWILNCNEENDCQTWFGADPIIM